MGAAVSAYAEAVKYWTHSFSQPSFAKALEGKMAETMPPIDLPTHRKGRPPAEEDNS